MPNNKTILQIMPADGWKAAYKIEDGPHITAPLVAWALVEEKDERTGRVDRYVVGIDAGGGETCFVEDLCNFDRYVAPGEEIEPTHTEQEA